MSYDPRIVIQSGDRFGEPIYCIPGAGDNVFAFTYFAAHAGLKCPVVGLQPKGLDQGQDPFESVEEATEIFLEAIKKTDDPSNIHLIGHSFGGWIAFNITLRLQEAGIHVKSVTMIDSDSPSMTPGFDADIASDEIFLKLCEVVEMAADTSFGLCRDDIQFLSHDERLRLLHRHMVNYKLVSDRSHYQMLAGVLKTFDSAVRIRYHPTNTYDRDVNYIAVHHHKSLIASDMQRIDDVVRQWQFYAPGLRPWIAPGNHMTVLKPPFISEVVNWWRKQQPLSLSAANLE